MSATLTLLNLKTLRNGERVELFQCVASANARGPSLAPPVFRLVWSDRHGVKGAKPRILDTREHTSRARALDQFNKMT